MKGTPFGKMERATAVGTGAIAQAVAWGCHLSSQSKKFIYYYYQADSDY